MNLTFRNVRESLAALGVSVRRLPDTGEYRVNLFRSDENSAYYTDDLEDAYLTGARMATRH